ncbi:hypothetical protein GCM10023144_31510 [Pigmentiphaga soli]|uniref:Extracellular solute-binding protein n=1 Tax=Pigmentiphaga soli TaxID=1007095 RepID=A0ABP8HAM4_9BURK
MKKILKAAAAAALACPLFALMASPAGAADSLARYQGPDREARLLEAAKKEGAVSIYYIFPNLSSLTDAFTRKYGIKVQAWRSSSEGVLQRVLTESRGNRFEVDLIQNSAQENEALHREHLLQPVISPNYANIIPEAVQAHHDWVGTKINVFISAYNTQVVKKEDVPASYEGFLDPKWKGKLGIEGNNQHWFATLSKAMGEDKARQLFGKIVDTNGISVRRGHSQLANLVASGEVPVSLTLYDWNIGPLQKKGAPIAALPLPPSVAQFDTLGMHARAPHPNAALLFYDFMLSEEGQKLIAAAGAIPVLKNFDSPYTRQPLHFVDPGQAIDMNDAWRKTFEDVILKKAG